jgi:hypothetical protein
VRRSAPRESGRAEAGGRDERHVGATPEHQPTREENQRTSPLGSRRQSRSNSTEELRRRRCPAARRMGFRSRRHRRRAATWAGRLGSRRSGSPPRLGRVARQPTTDRHADTCHLRCCTERAPDQAGSSRDGPQRQQVALDHKGSSADPPPNIAGYRAVLASAITFSVLGRPDEG